MKKIFAALAITLAFAPSGVLAQERAGDAALGALAGAVVLGPIGAVAGAVVGYTAGPSIAHSWGLRRSEVRYGGRSARPSGNAASNQEASSTQGVATAGPIEGVSAPPAKSSTQSVRRSGVIGPQNPISNSVSVICQPVSSRITETPQFGNLGPPGMNRQSERTQTRHATLSGAVDRSD
jgi:hypothetical protein